MTNIHPATSVDDALVMLDTRIPLLQSERRTIIQGLWETAFREGARQGRLAGVEAEKQRLLKIAGQLLKSDEPVTRGVGDALARIADIEAFRQAVESKAEYQDPTEAIRERLTRVACIQAEKRRRELDALTRNATQDSEGDVA